MKRHTRVAMRALALLGAIGASTARSEEETAWKFSGFGTVGAVATSTNEAQFRSSARQSRGASRAPDLGVDSRLGLQATVNFNETFAAVGQVLTSRRDGTDRPRLEWLFAQVSAMPWLDFRLGRMVLPVFMISDSRNVGYSAHWVRAPVEVYGTFAITSYDGVQAQLRTDWLGARFIAQASTGDSTANLYIFGSKLNLTAKALHSLNLVIERGDWIVRAGDTRVRGAELKNSPIPAPPVTDRFSGVGLAYDNGTLLLQTERVVRRQSSGGPFDSSSYYVTAGHRLGAWIPYLTFSRFEPEGSALTDRSTTRATAAGIRWDAFRNVALKAQFDSVPHDSLNFVGESAAFTARASKAHAFTLLVDFVF